MSADIPVDGHRHDRGRQVSSIPGPAAFLMICECGVEFPAANRYAAKEAWRVHVAVTR